MIACAHSLFFNPDPQGWRAVVSARAHGGVEIADASSPRRPFRSSGRYNQSFSRRAAVERIFPLFNRQFESCF